MYGCPIIKEEFVNFLNEILKGKIMKEFEGPVCAQCPRQGTPECFLRQKKLCLGPVTHGGCDAICTKGNFECMGCRGPRPKVDYKAEINLFKSFGLSEKEIMERLNMFQNIENGKNKPKPHNKNRGPC
jgi:coenzyme F420-reducing hydrogenase gamma subunit